MKEAWRSYEIIECVCMCVGVRENEREKGDIISTRYVIDLSNFMKLIT